MQSEQKKIICSRIDKISDEIDTLVDYLYITACTYTKFMLFNQIKSKLQELQIMNSLLYADDIQPLFGIPENQTKEKVFTISELKKYNGKNGNPAYVAINGVVYDVTNNAAWAEATHFGLSAGEDLTYEFLLCHASHAILDNLKIVGKLSQ